MHLFFRHCQSVRLRSTAAALVLVLLTVLPSNASADPPVVRQIKIEILEIFDEPNLGLFYRTVNAAKISTKEEIIRRELLIQEGDKYDSFLIEESIRNLRSLPFLRQVSIVPVRVGGQVDLYVRVQDTWTLYPFLNISSGGGTQRNSIGIAENNVLGYGKRLEFLVADDEGRQKIEGVYEDRRFLGSDKQLTLGHFQRSDGYRAVASYGKPFRSFLDEEAWSANIDTFDLVGRLFQNGEESYIYREAHTSLTGGYTWSSGDPEELLHRFTLGYDFTSDDFTQADLADYDDLNLSPGEVSNDLNDLPEDHRFSGPFASYQRVERDFLSINFVDRFERVEDFNLGNDFSISTHIAPRVLGSKQDTLLVKGYENDGWRLTPTSFLRGEVRGSSRADEYGISNTLVGGELKYFNIFGATHIAGLYAGKHTLGANLSLDYGDKMDKDFQLALGATNGLRGYKDRAFTGSQRLLFNIEDRFHLVEDVFKLVDVGGAFFFDAGGCGGEGFKELIEEEFYGDVGFGLRFALTRSSGGAVIRVDLAFPLRDGPEGSAKFEPRLFISTGQLFSAKLRSESLNSQAARVSSGFLP